MEHRPSASLVSWNNLAVSLAQSEREIRAAQTLRYDVFAHECGARLASAEEGLDHDAFDPYCDHLIVHDQERDKVVGTYRILPPHKAREAGRFYSETEFDVRNLHAIMPLAAEVGRTCIHRDYRHGAVIALLWSGLATYMRTRGYEYVMGCASIGLDDGGHAATETYLRLQREHLSPDRWRVFPLHPFPLLTDHVAGCAPMPPLVKGYVRLGAYVCGEPAWDRQFNTADLLMLLPLARINPRYARHFLGQPCLTEPSAA